MRPDKTIARKTSRSDGTSRPVCGAGSNERWLVVGICVFLAAITLAVFGRTFGYGFVNYDDDQYVYENPQVTPGLTLHGIIWASTFGEIGHWHPLTWFSHMLDCQLWGLNASGHHLTNVLLHTAVVILLFLALREMTGALWRSAFVAAVFAIHPLRVESVAWVAERKDVLSGMFFMLTLWAYVRHVRGPKSLVRHITIVVLFALGLMAKGMLVTLPFVLLLLDYWPLNRLGKTPLPRLIVEKIPLFVLSAASCVATSLVPEKVSPIYQMPLFLRIENAMVSCVAYLWQMVYPAGLAVVYPNPVGGLPLWEVALAFVLLAAVSAGAVLCWRKRPYFLIGWLWYLGVLVPVIGIVQISFYARADRYTYLPQIGLYIGLTWALAELSGSWRFRRPVLGGLAVVIIAVLSVVSFIQTSYWRDNVLLWSHTLGCTSGNPTAHDNLGAALLKKGRVGEAIEQFQITLELQPESASAHNNLGAAFLEQGRVDEAIEQYRKTIAIQPNHVIAHYMLGNLLVRKGQVDEAVSHYLKALEINPDNAEVHNNLGLALFQKGQMDEAIAHCQKALEINPHFAEAHFTLGNALFQKEQLDQAIAHYQQALAIRPNFTGVHYNLGNALLQIGRVDEAVVQYQKVLEVHPDSAEVYNKLRQLAWMLATSPDASIRNGVKAVELAQQANQLAGGKNPGFLHTLAAACAEAGRFDDAIQNAQKAIELARAAGQPDLVEQLTGELKLYEARLPFHQESK